MKFRSELAKMSVEEIVQEFRKHVRIMSWEEEIEFFVESNKHPQKDTILDWGICKKCLCKCKNSNNLKVLNVKAWVNLFKWTPMLSKESFLKYMMENFFEEEETLCTQKAWSNLPDVIKQAFNLIEEENTK